MVNCKSCEHQQFCTLFDKNLSKKNGCDRFKKHQLTKMDKCHFCKGKVRPATKEEHRIKEFKKDIAGGAQYATDDFKTVDFICESCGAIYWDFNLMRNVYFCETCNENAWFFDGKCEICNGTEYGMVKL